MFVQKARLITILLSALIVIFQVSSAKSQDVIRVFAAASLTGALSEIAALYQSRSNTRISAVFASSSTLAKQIINGAPADIFISANQIWMDRVEGVGRLEPSSRKILLGNALSLISAVAEVQSVNLNDRYSIEKALRGGRIAMGDPDHVPAGIYAKSAFGAMGYWDFLKNRIVATPNVRAALAFVERGEVNLGVVYASDIIGRVSVREVARFPAATHPLIVYPMSVVRGRALPFVLKFFDFLQTDAAHVIFLKYGFLKPKPQLLAQ